MLAETLPYGILILDTEDRIIGINRNCSFFLNITDPEPQARTYRQVLSENIEGSLSRVIQETRDKGYMLERTLRLSLSGGVQITAAVSSSLLCETGGIIYGMVIVFKEMTASQELERMRELDELKSLFISTVSHDLKAPLTSICGYADVLLQFSGEKLDEEETEYVRIIKQEGLRLTNMINDMLNVASIESGNLHLRPVLCSVKDILYDVLKVSVIDKARHSFFVDLEEGLPALWLDRDQMVRVFINLINNAVKYSPEGGTIKLRAYVKERNLQVDVIDPGVGMSQETLNHLFEKFFRARSDAVSQIKGTGLGLVITKGIVEEHGGIMAVKSNEGKGSTFSVILPLRLSEHKPESC